MRQARAVSLLESICELTSDRQHLRQWQRPVRPGEASGERLAFEELHHQVAHVVLPSDVVHRADMRVVEQGHGAGLALESRVQFSVDGDPIRKDLDGDGAVQARISRFVDFPHPASSKRCRDHVWAEASAGSECQRSRDYTGVTAVLEGLLVPWADLGGPGRKACVRLAIRLD